MAKFNFGAAVAFAPQTAEGTYNAALDAIGATLLDSDGLLLGDPESGVSESGLTLTLGRGKRDKAFIGTSFSRTISDFLKADVRTFTFSFPFCGNRADASGPPVDGDAIPLTGIDAILEGVGLVGTAWGSGVGHSYVFGSPPPFSALVYVNGSRFEFLDCRAQLSVLFEPTGIPIATATVEVGSIKDQIVSALPITVTYGEQATVSAPIIEAAAFTWQDARGFNTCTLDITPAIDTLGDSNAATGQVKEQSDRETSLTMNLFGDDTVDTGYEYSQLIEPTQGNLDVASFLIGDVMSGTDAVKAFGIDFPDPELDEMTSAALGTKASNEIKLIARGSVANNELNLIFQ